MGPPRSYDARERRLTCPRCLAKYRTISEGWLCAGCDADGTVEAVLDIVSALIWSLDWAEAPLTTCPADGCLIRPGEVCPACEARANEARTKTGYPVPRRGTVRPPIGWVRKGPILVQRRAA